MTETAELSRLLAAAADNLPLSQASLHPVRLTAPLPSTAELFPSARHPQAALAGLLLRLGHWEDSHAVAQDVKSAEGGYWHAILHRTEPDSFNAGYWFRRIGTHPIFPALHQGASEILASQGPNSWRLKAAWDPILFIDWCEDARKRGERYEASAIAIQMWEWRLLFEWCADSNA